jgi:hypothetical protein
MSNNIIFVRMGHLFILNVATVFFFGRTEESIANSTDVS